jgi:hypothetical protein
MLLNLHSHKSIGCSNDALLAPSGLFPYQTPFTKALTRLPDPLTCPGVRSERSYAYLADKLTCWTVNGPVLLILMFSIFGSLRDFEWQISSGRSRFNPTIIRIFFGRSSHYLRASDHVEREAVVIHPELRTLFSPGKWSPLSCFSLF